MFPFIPLRNPIGFGAIDTILLCVAVGLVGLFLLWKPLIEPAITRLAAAPKWSLLIFATLQVALRLALLGHHPIPVPDIYDEFGHLLVADTLRHFRLANPPHPFSRFFETFFVLQHPTYSSIYPIGNGLMMAIGTFLFGVPWAGVLLGTAAFCSLCYWMLRAWIAPKWALAGGLLGVFLFGPMNQWTNNYWGGEMSALAGCLVFGSLPRLKASPGPRPAILLGIGLAIHLLTRPYETLFLALSVLLYNFVSRIDRRSLAIAALVTLPALGITLLQNKQVTGSWMTLPYQLSMRQYGVPAPLTFQAPLSPQAQLTHEQELDYRMQSGFQKGPETVGSYFSRLAFRTRYYRFYFYAPLYIALAAFLISIRTRRSVWIVVTCLLFALGVNFFPAFQFHYVAAAACLFLLMSLLGMQWIAERQPGLAALIFALCCLQFGFWYTQHVVDAELISFDSWDSLNHTQGDRRREVASDLSKLPGKLVVFVRYWPGHPFQEKWVYNAADIDAQRIIWARDLGDDENRKLLASYEDRNALLLEPDARPIALNPYTPEALPATGPAALPSTQPAPHSTQPAPPESGKKPLLQLEQVR